jgi:hypothetical protein
MYIARKYPDNQIINVDEVALTDIKTHEQYHYLFSVAKAIAETPSLEKSTVVISSCADGTHLPSVLLLPLQSIPKNLYKFMSSDFYIIPAPPKGWMTQKILEWITDHLYLPRLDDRRIRTLQLTKPNLFLADGHLTRHSGRMWASCIKHNTDLCIEPAGVSDNAQANDRGINGPFKGGMGRLKPKDNRGTAGDFRESFTQDVVDQLGYALIPRTVRAAYLRAGVKPFTPWAPLGNCVSVFTPPGTKPPKEVRRQADNYVSGKVVARADARFSIDDKHYLYNKSVMEKYVSLTFFLF